MRTAGEKKSGIRTERSTHFIHVILLPSCPFPYPSLPPPAGQPFEFHPLSLSLSGGVKERGIGKESSFPSFPPPQQVDAASTTHYTATTTTESPKQEVLSVSQCICSTPSHRRRHALFFWFFFFSHLSAFERPETTGARSFEGGKTKTGKDENKKGKEAEKERCQRNRKKKKKREEILLFLVSSFFDAIVTTTTSST